MVQSDEIKAGELGYITAAIKEVAQTKVGDTIILSKDKKTQPLAGFKPSQPVVFCGLFPSNAAEFKFLRDALGKLKLNDSSLNNYPLTKSIAKNLGITSSNKTISKTLDEILDELLSTVEAGRDISKYLISLAVFLGLIGTFYGLLLTIGSVSNVIDGLSIDQQDFGVFFNNLRDGCFTCSLSPR